MTATYVYAVVPASVTANEEFPPGGADDLRLVVDGPVAAVVTTVPSADLTGTADDLMAHASVVDELNASGTTLPVRFGVVLEDDDAVVDHLLRRHRDRLNELLATVEGRVELRLRRPLRPRRTLPARLAFRSERSGSQRTSAKTA